MTEKARSNKTGKKAGKKQNFYANEVCYGLAIAMQMGMGAKEATDYVFDDMKAWSRKALPKGEKK